MDFREIDDLRRAMPEAVTFNYYDDCQSPWLLSRLMPERAAVADLRRTPYGKLLDRPGLRGLVACCGGMLDRRDVAALAHADRVDVFDHMPRASNRALEAIWSTPWQDYHVTFADWGRGMFWGSAQVSREGGSLVIQLGFPSDHAQIMGQYLPTEARAKFEESYHPVRRDGRPTLAWARVDIDTRRSEALIEEVQCDWLRLVADEIAWLAEAGARERELRAHQAYERALYARYARVWPRAMLLATLAMLHEQLGINRIWMHMPEPGAVLKGIRGTLPPRSLYTRLPQHFCFTPTAEIPPMLRPAPGQRPRRLAKARLARIARMQASGQPVFWRLDLRPLEW